MKRQALAAMVLAAGLMALTLPAHASLHYAMAVEVWTDRSEDFFYLPGDPLRVYFRAPEDCYVVLYQIDTEGNVYLLFPSPYGRAFFARGGVVYCVNDFLSVCDLAVFGASGVGYVGVLASPVPFWVPRWLSPHPAFGVHRVIYVSAYYPTVVIEPYLAICDLNARIVAGWGAGLRFGFGYCWFYVERRSVPPLPIWHPRYWEVRVVTRPVFDRLWHHHDRFYRVPSTRGDHPGPRPESREAGAPRPFERPRAFRAAPHPAPPAWVRAVHEERAIHQREVSRGRELNVHNPGRGSSHDEPGRARQPLAPDLSVPTAHECAEHSGRAHRPEQRVGRCGHDSGTVGSRQQRGPLLREVLRERERTRPTSGRNEGLAAHKSHLSPSQRSYARERDDRSYGRQGEMRSPASSGQKPSRGQPRNSGQSETSARAWIARTR